MNLATTLRLPAHRTPTRRKGLTLLVEANSEWQLQLRRLKNSLRPKTTSIRSSLRMPLMLLIIWG